MKRNALFTVCSLATLLSFTACEDPSVEVQERAAAQIRTGGAKIAQAARLASLDRVSAAEELRTAGAKLENIPGASDGQKQVAASLVANALTQSALLEICKADQIESANRSTRMLAKRLLQVSDDIQGIVNAEQSNGIAQEASSFQPSLSTATQDQRTHESEQSDVAEKVTALRAANESAVSDAQALMAEAEQIRIQGLSASRGEITLIAEQAGRKRDEARILQTKADEAGVETTHQESILRLRTGEALGAARQAKAFGDALAVLDRISSGQTTSSAQETAISDELKAKVVTLVTASDPEEDSDLKGCYERTFSDLEKAEGAVRRSGPKNSSSLSIAAARARALLMRGEGEFQQGLLIHALAMSPSMTKTAKDLNEKAASWLTKAQASTKSAIEAYTALQEVLASSGTESPSKQALALTIERALKVKIPSFEIMVIAPTKAVRNETTAEVSKDAGDAAANVSAASAESASEATSPPFETAEKLAAFFGTSKRPPALSARIDELLVATTPDGQALASTAFGAVKAIGQLQVAMQDKFGSSNLGPLSAMVGQGSKATLSDVTADSATLSVGNAQGSLAFKATRTADGWKLDLDATSAEMDEGMKSQLAAAGSMMATLTEGLTGITAQIESGKIESAQAVQGALMMAMQKLMGGGASGGAQEN